jgi:protein-S-isoprenylcysteine O-methyltransferase Ste14
MVRIGNFFFRTRNFLFPVFYVFLFLPFRRISPDYMTVFYAGLAVALAGQLVRMLTIGMAYIVRGGKNRRIYAAGLVTDGLFSHCRNPMYVGNILLVVGMSILSNSLFAVLVMIPLFLFIYQAITLAEENFLRDKFGTGFDDYCSQVNRWLPRLKGIGSTFRNNSFDFTKVLFKEYNSTFLWTFGATLLLAYNTYWFNENFSINQEGKCFLIALGVLLTLYFVVRFLKKRRSRLNRLAKEKDSAS